MSFDVAAARKAGYSDAEIAQYLGQQHGFDADGAMKSGYAPEEIISHLSADATTSKTAPEPYPTFSKIPGFGYVRPAVDTLAGFGSQIANDATNFYDLARKIPYAGQMLPDSSNARKEMTAPDTVPANLGKFAAQTLEFAYPASKVTLATKGMGLLSRALAGAGVSGLISGVQSNFDPTNMAIGAGLGAGGEVVSDAAKAFRSPRAPTLKNFSESFGNATPTQKGHISKALATLESDGIKPAANLNEMHDVLMQKLEEIKQSYSALDPAIKLRELDPATLEKSLNDLQSQYMRRGAVTDQSAFDTIASEIAKLREISMGKGGPSGKLIVDDLIHLKQGANGKTAWNSPDADKSLWRGIGDAYRQAADFIAPETTRLNQAYQKYSDLVGITAKNLAQGKGSTTSGLSALMNTGARHAAGGSAGAAIGGALGGPVGAAVGGTIGTIAGPKIGKVASQALQNAIDSGFFNSLLPVKQQAIKAMQAAGDNAGILRALGMGAAQSGLISASSPKRGLLD